MAKDGKKCSEVHICDRKNNGGCSQVCLKNGKKARCTCEKGFKLLPDKMTCEEIHPCDKKSKGGCTHICLKKGDEALCACPKDMVLDNDRKTCNIGMLHRY